MSSNTNETAERNRVSKVSFSPISSELMVVRIRKVSTEVRQEDIPEMSTVLPPTPQKHSKKKKDKNHSRSTTVEGNKEIASASSQPSNEEKNSLEIRDSKDDKKENDRNYSRFTMTNINEIATTSSLPPSEEKNSLKIDDSKDDKKKNERIYSRFTMTDPKEIATSSSLPPSKEENSLKIGDSKDDKKKNERIRSRFTMTDPKEIATTSSQTPSEEKKNAKFVNSKNYYTPCLRHAAENIGRKASALPSEKINMCNNCSKSMLSYIFLVQDFLDSLAIEISGGETDGCLQCARQEVRNNVAASEMQSGSESLRSVHSNQNHRESRHKDVSNAGPSNKQHSRTRANRSEPMRRNDDSHKDSVPHTQQAYSSEQYQQSNLNYNMPSTSSNVQDNKSPQFQYPGNEQHISGKPNDESSYQQHNVHHNPPHHHHHHQWTGDDNEYQNQNNQNEMQRNDVRSDPREGTSTNPDHSSHWHESGGSHHTEEQSYERPTFRAPMERRQPNFDAPAPNTTPDHHQNDSNNFHTQSPSLYRDDVDGIISTLSNIEREIYESARNKAGWEGFTEPQERFALPPSSNLIASEAYVTSCRNNAEAIGCLVVGTSLLLCRSSRTLCVLVSDGVSTAFRNALSSVFQVVQYTRSLDSLGTTKLALLEQPEIGVNFEKLNIWRLTQFSKCIYLNPDTLVIQNCDELFNREELSAVPDIGWPDCFNSGVFVYYPSVETFWKLMEFAEKQGSYDGGDQGLLNSYFSSWSTDINKKLSFIYNLMANVSYTYTPAFKQFGRDVKIVQFHGSFKPWHVKFFSKNGQISPSSPVHPTYVQFVHIWLSIFRISVLRLLPKNIQSYAATEETICAVETLRFFPLPTESEADFFLTPPSVRVRLAERKLNRSTSLPISEARRRKSAEFPRYTDLEDVEAIPEQKTPQTEEVFEPENVPKPDDVSTSEVDKKEEEASETGEVVDDSKPKEKKKVRDKNAIPGSDVGDYQGMKAWEQGRMDYQGSDSSDNVIKRLEFLMSKSK